MIIVPLYLLFAYMFIMYHIITQTHSLSTVLNTRSILHALISISGCRSRQACTCPQTTILQSISMLSIVVSRQSSRIVLRNVVARSLSTETESSSESLQSPLPAQNKHPNPSKSRMLDPKPRPTVSHKHQTLYGLPVNFGRNQMLPVSNSTRALLESIVAQFNAPIRYAFAYGSGVFEQDGYTKESARAGDVPMLDFMFAVTHSDHWHSMNMQQHLSHYTLHARTFGSSYVSRIQEFGPGVWFNAYVPMEGVVSVLSHVRISNLISFLII